MRAKTKAAMSRRTWLAGVAPALLTAAAPEEPLRLPRKIRLALLGLDGHTGEILSPLPRLADVELVAVSDPDPQALARAKKNPRLANAKPYGDYRRMLEAERLDMVAVCNPNGDRAAGILACTARKLHVIAEKPIALTRGELAQIKKAVAEQNVRLSTLLPMRFSGPYLALKKIVSEGRIGEVAQIGSQKSYKAGDRPAWMRRRSSYGGTIPWIGIHMIDLMRWTSGREFTEAFSLQSQIGHFPGIGEMENTTASIFALDNGGVATLRMDYFRPETAPTHGDDRLRLAGTEGVAEYQAATGVTLLHTKSPPQTIRELPASRSVFVDFLEHVYLDKPTALPLDDIFRVHEIVLAAQGAATGHRLVKV